MAIVIRCFAAVWLASPVWLEAGPHAQVGRRWERLQVGDKAYLDVVVRDVTPRTIVILHAGGMASIKLSELEPAMQSLFGYCAEAEQAADAQAERERHLRQQREARRRVDVERRRGARSERSFETLLDQLSEVPEVASEVDLRPRFNQLALSVKNQGRRPSCAVFAVVSALEFQNAVLTGQPEKLSEEYLIWASRKITRRFATVEPHRSDLDADFDGNDQDEGFSLAEVVTALRTYGIPRQDAMPNTFGVRMGAITEPSRLTVEEARQRRRVFIHLLPAREKAAKVAQITHALNAEVPVPIGLRWPQPMTVRSGYLHAQKPVAGYAHAVTLVGYRCETGRLEDAVFLFKNSYGGRWGQGGYGWVSYRYLHDYLLDAVLLEVQRNDG